LGKKEKGNMPEIFFRFLNIGRPLIKNKFFKLVILRSFFNDSGSFYGGVLPILKRYRARYGRRSRAKKG